MDEEDAQWAKIGFVEDRRAKVRYPGQALLVTRRESGPLAAYLFVGDDLVHTTTFLHDKLAKPGSGRRLFFGFYDPHSMYAEAKRIEAWERDGIAERAAERQDTPIEHPTRHVT
jgi:hypothetical protein